LLHAARRSREAARRAAQTNGAGVRPLDRLAQEGLARADRCHRGRRPRDRAADRPRRQQGLRHRRCLVRIAARDSLGQSHVISCGAEGGTRMKRFVMVSVLLIASGALADEKAAKKSMPEHMPKMSDAQITKLAMSAGPADVSKDATIAVMNDDMKTLREVKKGTNGWLCMVMGEDSMCADAAWQKWAEAWLGHTKPAVTGVGVAYMLNGDHGASNTDPYAMAAKPDNNWIVSPPHIM